MVFNVMSRNQDDHVKNIAFLMNQDGQWSLSPAYDMTYSYNPDGAWTSNHQMTINAKRSGIGLADLKAVAVIAQLPRGKWGEIYEQVRDAIAGWQRFTETARLPQNLRDEIQSNLFFELV